MIEQRLRGDERVDRADDGAVPHRDIGEMIGEQERADARHVLDDDHRIAGNVLPNMFGNETAIGIVAAADGGADDQVDCLALVKILRLQPGAPGACDKRGKDGGCRDAYRSTGRPRDPYPPCNPSVRGCAFLNAFGPGHGRLLSFL